MQSFISLLFILFFTLSGVSTLVPHQGRASHLPEQRNESLYTSFNTQRQTKDLFNEYWKWKDKKTIVSKQRDWSKTSDQEVETILSLVARTFDERDLIEAVKKYDLPKDLVSLIDCFTHYGSDIRIIFGNGFLKETKAKRITLNHLPNVVSIKNGFLSESNAVENVSINLPNVESVGDYFIYGCNYIKSFDLSLLNAVVVGNNFLALSSFERFSTLNLSNIEVLGNCFFYGSSIKNFFIISLDKIKKIRNNFLGQTDFEFLTLSLPNVISVGNNFIAYSRFDSIALIAFNIKYVGDYFFHGSKSLNPIILHLPKLETTGNDFLGELSTPSCIVKDFVRER